MNAFAVGREVVRVGAVEELVPPVGEERHVRVHARAVLAEERLRHEGRVDAVLRRDLLHDQPVGDRRVGHLERGCVAHVDLVLRRRHLVVVVLDRNADALQRLDRLVPQLGRGVERRHREVAALVEGLRALVVLEEEVLELGPDVERVEAHRPHPLERLAQHVARVALVRLSVRGDDVADHPADDRLAGSRRHDPERLGIRDRDHVRLLDRVEAGDRRAVEAHPVVERGLDLARGDREALQMPLEIGEPEEHVRDLLLLDLLQHLLARLRVGRRAMLALDHPHAVSSFENRKAPNADGRVRGSVAAKDRASLHQSAPQILKLKTVGTHPPW